MKNDTVSVYVLLLLIVCFFCVICCYFIAIVVFQCIYIQLLITRKPPPDFFCHNVGFIREFCISLLLIITSKNVMLGAENSNWFALYTAPRAEKQVANRLSSYGIDNFLPVISVARAWSDRVKIIEQPLFSSYVFVKCNTSELRDTLGVSGVVRAVYYDKKPAIIKDSEMDAIRDFIEQSRASACTVEMGDNVDILCGALKNVSGRVVKIGKNHLYLYLDKLCASICVRRDVVVKNTKSV